MLLIQLRIPCGHLLKPCTMSVSPLLNPMLLQRDGAVPFSGGGFPRIFVAGSSMQVPASLWLTIRGVGAQPGLCSFCSVEPAVTRGCYKLWA